VGWRSGSSCGLAVWVGGLHCWCECGSLTPGRRASQLRDMSRAERLQQLRDLRQKEERRDCTFRPQIHSRPRAGPASPPSNGGGVSEPAYNRLYKHHTSAYESSHAPVRRRPLPKAAGATSRPPGLDLACPSAQAATSDTDCTFQPNLSHGPEATSKVTRSRQHLEQVGDALYKDAHNRQIRRQMIQARALGPRQLLMRAAGACLTGRAAPCCRSKSTRALPMCATSGKSPAGRAAWRFRSSRRTCLTCTTGWRLVGPQDHRTLPPGTVVSPRVPAGVGARPHLP